MLNNNELDYRYFFHVRNNPFKIGDEVAINFGTVEIPIYKKGIIASESYISEAGCTYIDVKVKDQLYGVPLYDVKPLNEVRIINTAYIYYKSYNRPKYYSRQGCYILEFDGEEIYSRDGCTGRTDANKKLINSEILEKYKIDLVYSNSVLVFRNENI